MLRAQLAAAAYLMKNHWLAEARARFSECQKISFDPKIDALIKELDRQMTDPHVLNLSQKHQPIGILKEGRILSTLHLEELDDLELKKQAFKQGVHYIDLETSSQCNRRCTYCTNVTNDRLSFNKFIEGGRFERLIADLASIDYDKELHFVGYNEPLMHKESILEHIIYARKALPHARLQIFTNGDYLDAAYLDEIADAGVNHILISLHLAAGQAYDDASMERRIRMMGDRLGRGVEIVEKREGQSITAHLHFEGPMFVELHERNYMANGHNRGGLLEGVGKQFDARTEACLAPFYQFIVGYKGTVTPCCVLVGDDPRHATCSTGTIEEDKSIFDIYAGRSYVEWRRALLTHTPKKWPCNVCPAGREQDESQDVDLVHLVAEVLQARELAAS